MKQAGGKKIVFTKEFISILTTDIIPKAPQLSGRSLSSAVNEPVPFRPPPRPLRGRLLTRSGPERNLHAPVPALCRSRPSVAI